MADNTCGWYDVGCQFEWIVDEVKALFIWSSEQVFDAVVAVADSIPVPGWADNVGSLAFPSDVLWFASAFELSYGAAVVASAYSLRFVIRRIPLFG